VNTTLSNTKAAKNVIKNYLILKSKENFKYATQWENTTESVPWKINA